MGRSRTRSGDLNNVFRAGTSEFLNLIAQLSILYEDLRIEIAGFQVEDSAMGALDTIAKSYRKLYFIRRSLVTLVEAGDCVAAISRDREFRQHKTDSRIANLQHVSEAREFFLENTKTIKGFRDEFGGHLDTKAVARATSFLDVDTPGLIAFEEPRIGNFVLQNHFAATILQAAVLSKLKPGIDFTTELNSVLLVVAKSVNHVQLATQALVYGFLWERFV
jgi:hypothetical protein